MRNRNQPQDPKIHWKGYITAFAAGGLAADIVVGFLAYKNLVIAAEVTCFTLRALKIISGGTAVVLGWSSAIPSLIGAVAGMALWWLGKYIWRSYKSNQERIRIEREQRRL